MPRAAIAAVVVVLLALVAPPHVAAAQSVTAGAGQNEGCLITTKTCPLQTPTDGSANAFVGAFRDAAGEAATPSSRSDSAACLQRAREYFEWCGTREQVTATFLATGARAFFPIGACWLSTRACPVQQQQALAAGRDDFEFVGIFRDAHGEATMATAVDEEACLSRAQAYALWCNGFGAELDSAAPAASLLARPDILSLQPVTAIFEATGNSRTFPPSACLITTPRCTRGAEFAGTFRDHEGERVFATAELEGACHNRARDYHDWCALTDADGPVVATFVATSNSAAYPPGTCEIHTPRCAQGNGDEFVGAFEDKNGEERLASGILENRCHMRAKDYHEWCALSDSESVLAVFKPTNDSALWPPGRCVITTHDCPLQQPTDDDARNEHSGAARKNFFVGEFDDTFGERRFHSGAFEQMCHRRARDYYEWCGSHAAVSARYEPTGVSKSYPERVCEITTKECSQGEAWTGTFHDKFGEEHFGASVDERACVRRAKDFYEWCDSAEEVTASYLPTGRSVVYPGVQADLGWGVHDYSL